MMKKYRLLEIILFGIIIVGIIIVASIIGIKNYNIIQKEKKIEHSKTLFSSNLIKELNNNTFLYEEKNKKLYILKQLKFDGLTIFDELKQNFDNNYISNYNYYTDYEAFYAPDNIISLIIYEKIENEKDKNIISNTYYYNYNSNMELLKDTYIFRGDYRNKINELIGTDEYHYILTNAGIKFFTSDKQIDVTYENMIDYLNINYENKTTSLIPIDINENFNDVDMYKYATTTNNMYDTYNQNSNKIMDINKGNRLKILSEGSNFSKALFNDNEGYVLNKYLTSDFILKDGYTSVSDTRYINYKAVRIWPDDIKEGDPIAVLGLGDEVKRVGYNDNWSVFTYNDSYAYVETENTDSTKPQPVIETSKNSYIINTNIRENSTIDPSKPMVALTYDDGPNPYSTMRILDTLEKYNVTATFFDVGYLVSSYPNVTKRESEIGEVGSHTYNHYNLNNLSYDEIRNEVDKTDTVIENVIGYKPNLLRPPYGNANSFVRDTIYDHALINWNVDTVDWRSRDRDSIVNEVGKISNLDGHIILMHSIYSSTADATEIIVPELLNKGYQLVTISELAKYKGYSLVTGKLYYGF